MGGIAQFPISQATPDQQAAFAAQLQSTATAPPSTQTQTPPQAPPQTPATSGYSSDIANPSAMPINSTVIPGSTQDLENRAAQAPQQVGQQIQAQRSPQQAPGAYSSENPYAPIVQDYQARAQATAPKEPGTGVKGLLTSYFKGMGSGMMVQAGLTPPDVRHDQIVQHLTAMTQMANQWEQLQGMSRYRDALTNKMQQDQAFESQMQPLRLQSEQQTLAAGQQAATTIHPAMSAADLKALGVPDDLASQYQGKPLTSADFTALKDLSAAGATRIFDYGQDGAGTGKGQWLVDRNFNEIKQLSPISEAGRATSLAKQQFAQQNALIKGMQAPVYAYDPSQKMTVLTTQSQAQQGGMQAIRGVKETDIRHDMSDTRVLNDVAVKSNNMLDSSAALDQNQNQRDIINWAMSQGENQIKLGAFGTQIPTGWINTLANSANMGSATQQTKDYVVNALSLREAAMGLQKVLTGSARANDAQINALQATIPGLETNGALARQKLAAFTQNVDMLRQGIPKMPGIDVVPTRSTNSPRAAGAASVSQPTGSAGFNWNNYPVVGAPQ